MKNSMNMETELSILKIHFGVHVSRRKFFLSSYLLLKKVSGYFT